MHSSIKIYGLLAATFLLSAIVLWPGVSGPFLFDDESNIPKSFIQELSWDEISAASLANNSGLLKRPVSAFSFAITQYTTGPEPDGFKIHNILIHLLTGLMIFLASKRIFLALKFEHKQQQWAALLCTAFWLLHPLHISTVLYPVQRMAQLATLFSLASIYCYLHARQKPHRQQLWLLVFLPCSLLLAIFSKENGALIPAYLLIIEAILFKFNKDNASNSLKISWLLFIATPILLGLFHIITHPELFNYSTRSFSLIERLYTQQWIVLDYLKMITLPNITDMGVFHDDFKVTNTWQQAMPAVLFHLTLAGIAILSLKRAAFISLGITWFYAGHLMESTAIPLELMFEHRNYLSLAGIALIFGGVISLLSNKPSIKILAGILLIHLSLSSFERSQVWSNSTSLYQHNATNHPQSARAHISYANELLVQKEIDLAVKLLLKASQLNPDDAGPLLHIIKVGCFGPLNYREGFYPKLQQYYSNNPLSSYGQQSLHQISHLFITDQCPTLNVKQFTDLLDSVSDYSLSQKRQAEILLIKARLASKTDLSLANHLYQQSYQLNPDPRLLSEQAATLIAQQEINLAFKLVEQLKLQQDNLTATQRREFKDLFDWYRNQKNNKQLIKSGDKP